MVKPLTALLAALVFVASCALHEQNKPDASAKAPDVAPLPLLHIQPEVFDLGDIKEGEAAIATFLVRNNHQQPVELVDIQTSCGCTAAEPDSFLIMPGGFTQLRVAVDTTAKQHGIKKTVTVRDSLGAQAKAMLVFNVVENPHKMQGKVSGIFDGKCASCHFQPLVGKTEPAALYATGCAMCHGADADGDYAPSLRGASMQTLKHIIAKGTGKPQMPGFSMAEGGPLTEAQINALAKWLAHLPE